ncbi:GPP34 family phosphoprotein [Reichenbachiella sp. MALMAid0571]|uniref:GOLPH3/VPS74 family protein n=1 Tax=Reichenbachiella sp. MALMAid0571 TaxID=3143939 RepID=UPI0032DE2D84
MKLSIAEGLMLIALDDDEGRLLAAAEHSIDKGLIASCILELSLSKKVSFQGGKIVMNDNSGTGNKILDSVLKGIGNGGDSVVQTIDRLAPGFDHIQDEIIELLVQRGILSVESTKLLFIPISERMDNANYAFEQEIRDVLKAVVLKGQKPSPAVVVLMCMISYCKILEEVFPDEDELIDAIKVAKDVLKIGVVDNETKIVLEDLKIYFAKI